MQNRGRTTGTTSYPFDDSFAAVKKTGTNIGIEVAAFFTFRDALTRTSQNVASGTTITEVVEDGVAE